MPDNPDNLGVTYVLGDLIYLMQRLRDPESGCPWDLEQTYKSIVPSTIEEAYEVADAIERGDFAALEEELGDYLFQAIFYCQLASEQGLFDMHSVVDGLVAKLVRRHPHVFPDGTLLSRRKSGSDDQQRINRRWEELKQEERENKGMQGVFDDVPSALPALSRAEKIQKRAARQKFDWSSEEPVYAKIEEELAELRQAVSDGDLQAVEAEMGDLLFSCVNLSRHLKVDAETASRRATNKFKTRYLRMQKISLEQFPDKTFEELDPDQMEVLWQQAKLDEQG